jgi:hypothetical protein
VRNRQIFPVFMANPPSSAISGSHPGWLLWTATTWTFPTNLRRRAGRFVSRITSFLGRRPSPNELTSTHHKGPFGGTPWHGSGDSCRYGSGSQVAARPAVGDSGKGFGDALLGHAELAGDLGLRAATASQRQISSSRSMVLRPSSARQARPAARCGTLRLR